VLRHALTTCHYSDKASCARNGGPTGEESGRPAGRQIRRSRVQPVGQVGLAVPSRMFFPVAQTEGAYLTKRKAG